MESLPNLIHREAIRMQISDRPNPSIVIGAAVCPECDGEGLTKEPEHRVEDSLTGQIMGICVLCLGSTNDPDGATGIDILPALERLTIEISGGGAYAHLLVKVDADLDFDFDEMKVAVSQADGGLDGLTAEELEAVVITCPASAKVGDKLLQHLRDRASSGS